MAGLTDTALDQPPRRETLTGDLPELNRTVDAMLGWMERVRRRLQRVIPHYHAGSATYNPPNIVARAQTTTTVTATGASIGDVTFASFSLTLAGLTMTAYVSATDTVTVVLFNGTVGAVDLASGTLKVWTFTPPSVA